MTKSSPHRFAAALLAVTFAGCATVDPHGAFEATRELTAGRHPGEVRWLREAGEREAAEARVRELLAAPLTLDGAAEVALLRNPRLQATLEELGVAQADFAQATRLANLGVSFESLRGGGETKRTVSLTADVVDWLVLPLRRRVAAAELERTKLEVGQALLATVGEARLALVRYRAAAQSAEQLAQGEEVDRAGADYARALFAAGNLTALERARAEAEWAEGRAALARARAEEGRRREALVRVLGLVEEERWSAAELPAPPAADVDATALETTALETAALAERLDLRAARWAVDAVGRALALKRGTRFFPVGVELGVERERETDGVTLTGPVVELRLPLFDTGKASVARLEAELARARWQLAALTGEARSAVREAAAALVAAREVAELYSESVLPLRREVLDATLREHNQMLIGTFDLLRAKKDEIAAQQRAGAALAEYWQARVELERAVGVPLAAVAADPDSHPASDDPAVADGGQEDPR